jgi:hypothetical protein
MLRRRIWVPALGAGCVLFACAVAVAAITPAAGVYQGTVNGHPSHDEGEGYFKVVGGGSRIVAYPVLRQIHVPTDFICKPGDPTASNVLKAPRIPIKAGAFDYSGTPTGIAGRHIEVKGHWTSAKHLVGFTKTTGGGCNHSVRWQMDTPPPP